MYESVAQANLANDARAAAYDGGSLRFYSGERPANVAAGVSGTLLATLPLAATAFGDSANRVLTAGTITTDAVPDNAGTIGYAACFAANGTTLLSLHTVGVGSGEIQVNSLTVSAGLPVSCSAFTITQPDGA